MSTVHIASLLVIISLLFSCTDDTIKDSSDIIKINNRSYQLYWADEFSEDGLPNPNNWRYEVGKVRNNEAQYYTEARLENCRVIDGKLQLTARNDSFNQHPITSGSIETLGLQEFKYGYIEVRAKMPLLGSGTWPAIWMMGTNVNEVKWPRCGEIDIMEWVGKLPGVFLGSVWLPHAEIINREAESRSWPYLVSPYEATHQFHNFAIEWEEDIIRYYVDGFNYISYQKVRDINPISWEPLNKPFYIKLNLAMGGEIPPIGGGGNINYNKFPYTFEVDYVRYYTRIN